MLAGGVPGAWDPGDIGQPGKHGVAELPQQRGRVCAGESQPGRRTGRRARRGSARAAPAAPGPARPRQASTRPRPHVPPGTPGCRGERGQDPELGERLHGAPARQEWMKPAGTRAPGVSPHAPCCSRTGQVRPAPARAGGTMIHHLIRLRPRHRRSRRPAASRVRARCPCRVVLASAASSPAGHQRRAASRSYHCYAPSRRLRATTPARRSSIARPCSASIRKDPAPVLSADLTSWLLGG